MKAIFDFIVQNFFSIVIMVGLIGVAVKVANLFLRVGASLLVILIFMKIFFL